MMPDREKVIKGVHDARRYFEDREWVDKSVGVHIDALNDVLAMLKEQEAVEPRKKNDGKPQPWTCWWYVCGDCGQEIEYHDRFCRWCGRLVKWE